MASTLKTIETLPPEVYEMIIEDHKGEDHAKTFEVSFAKRTMADLADRTGAWRAEAGFAGVARMSKAQTDFYETTVGSVLRSMVREEAAQAAHRLHPMRASRTALWSDVPCTAVIGSAAAMVQGDRQPAEQGNPFLVTARSDRHGRNWLGHAPRHAGTGLLRLLRRSNGASIRRAKGA